MPLPHHKRGFPFAALVRAITAFFQAIANIPNRIRCRYVGHLYIAHDLYSDRCVSCVKLRRLDSALLRSKVRVVWPRP